MPRTASRLRGLHVLIAAWCFSLPSFAVFAEPADQLLLTRLASPDYQQREAATQTLLQDRSLTLDRLAVLHAAATTVEQRHRLLEVARHHTLSNLATPEGQPGQDASIGIAHQVLAAGETGHGRPVVLVRQTLPGFPGYAYLLPGDLILAINGRQLAADADESAFVGLIREHQPGSTVQLTIEREGQTRVVEMPLGRADMLGAVYPRPGLTPGEPYRTICRRVHNAVIGGKALDIDRLAKRD